MLATLPIGAVIGSLAKNPNTVNGLVTLPIIGITAISGIFYPIFALPGWVQVIAQVFPIYWLGLGLRSAFLPDSAASVEIRVNGIELGYQVVGEGEPLILLHGGFGSVEMFGPNVELLAAGRQVIGVDLQSHGRSPATDRPMRFETMADDIATLIRSLGFERAAIMGFSLGGAVGLRTAIQQPAVVERLVLVSTVFKRHGWFPEMTAGMDAMGPEIAGDLLQTPMYEAYQRVAPRVEDWPVLVRQVTDVVKVDYDWSAEIPGLSMPVMLVIGDADGMPPSHAVEFFGLLGGGQRDASWDRSGMTHHRLATLPGVTHYDINVVPALSAAAIPFLDCAAVW